MAKKVIAKPATPSAVAKPTQVKTTELYSKAWKNSFEEKAKLPKPVIFELTKHTRGRKGEKVFPVSAFFEARDIIFDPETGQRREIRYCKNEPSIYMEDQASYSKSEIIRFQNGVVVAMPNNPALIKFLRISNLCKDNPNRLADKPAAFYEIKPTVAAKLNIQEEITVLDAVSLALRAPLEKVMPIAKYLNIDTTRAVVEIRQDLKSMANKNAKAFIELFDNKEAILKGTIKTAEEYKIISVTPEKIQWDNGSLICGVPLGAEPYQALIDYIKEKGEFESFNSTLEKKLNDIINS
jgi:hypothetical protein